MHTGSTGQSSTCYRAGLLMFPVGRKQLVWCLCTLHAYAPLLPLASTIFRAVTAYMS